MKNKFTSSWVTAFLTLVIFWGVSCRKMDLQAPVAVAPVTDNADTVVQKFFSITENTEPVIAAIRNNILRQQSQKPFVEKFVNYAGYPVWDKAVIKNPVENTAGNSLAQRGGDHFKMAFIPLAAANDSVIKAILKVKINGSDTSFKVLYRWQYNQYGYGKVKQHNNADQTALLFMGFENHVFGHKEFKINDTLLFNKKNKNSTPDTITITSFNNYGAANRMVEVTITICYDEKIPDVARTSSIIVPCHCHIEHVCDDYSMWVDDDGGGDSSTPPGSSGGGGGNNDGGNWNDDPCAPSAGGDPGTPIPPTRLTQMAPPCDGNGDDDPWVPVPIDDEPTDREANGYLYSRITELQTILEDFPQALEPCDSLNIMPLDTYGAMWQNVAQFTPSQYVKDRIDSIKNVAPQWWLKVDNFNIQSLDEASGALVNCDFFPVRITQLPTGYTPETLLEYFRKHINNFIGPDLSTSFGPYIDGDFNDVQKYIAPFEESIGTLWSLKLGPEYVPGIDGSVIESGYSRYNSGGYQSDYFTFSTMTTPLDFGHPVSGNRRFGIYSDPDHPGEYVFYTMGVDRISDGVFGLGNRLKEVISKEDGFDDADSLWTSLQTGMIQFIQDNNGAATFYSNHNTIARPQWEDVAKYLHGDFDFVELKRRLGC